MPWPAPGFFTGFATQGQLRQALDDLLARSRAQIGADGVENATIAGGAIAPSKGSVRLYGEGATADTLVSLDVAAYDEGQLVELRIGDVNQPVTVQHAASPAAGQFALRAGLSLELNALQQRLVIQRSGTSWVEWARDGLEQDDVVGVDTPFAFGWVSEPGNMTYYKDSDGIVHVSGFAMVQLPNQTMFTLKAGYRPAVDRFFPAYSTSPAVDVVRVTPAGLVFFMQVTGPLAPGEFVHLFASFRAAQ